MELKEIINRNQWESFFQEIEDKTFLQSWSWRDFHEKSKNKFWCFGVFENESLLCVALVVKIKAKRGTFLLIQHGPTFSNEVQKKNDLTERTFKFFIEKIKLIAVKEKASFVRMNPLLKRNENNQNMFKKIGLVESLMHANAYESTWRINIQKKDEDILKEARKTTRYLIRQAQKNEELKIIKSTDSVDLNEFNRLTKQVAQKRNFVPFSSKFTENQLDVLKQENEALLFLGKKSNETISSALIVFWSGVCFYHQAALSVKHHKTPISYLMQWEIIQEAKKRNCFVYDMWGYVDPKANPSHPWAGPTLFKTGFGGEKKEYMKTQDLIVSRKYWINRGIEKIRKTKRGL